MITSSSSGYDSIRTIRMAGYGLLLLGPSQHLWFNLLSKSFPKRDMLTTFKKMFLGQAVYGPATTTVFFSYNAVLQGKSISFLLRCCRAEAIFIQLKFGIEKMTRNGTHKIYLVHPNFGYIHEARIKGLSLREIM